MLIRSGHTGYYVALEKHVGGRQCSSDHIRIGLHEIYVAVSRICSAVGGSGRKRVPSHNIMCSAKIEPISNVRNGVVVENIEVSGDCASSANIGSARGGHGI